MYTEYTYIYQILVTKVASDSACGRGMALGGKNARRHRLTHISTQNIRNIRRRSWSRWMVGKYTYTYVHTYVHRT